jgi:uncharacterized membrane protein
MQSAIRLGHRLFVPALLIPVVTLLVALFGSHLSIAGYAVFAKPQMTLTGLALACVIALFAASRVTRSSMPEGLIEGRRLLDAIGWAAFCRYCSPRSARYSPRAAWARLLPGWLAPFLPTGSALACLLAFALGMVLFTVIMGNAFAAFPVMMAGIGLPLLIQQHGATRRFSVRWACCAATAAR